MFRLLFRCLAGSEEVICSLTACFYPLNATLPHASYRVVAQPPSLAGVVFGGHYYLLITTEGAIPAIAPQHVCTPSAACAGQAPVTQVFCPDVNGSNLLPSAGVCGRCGRIAEPCTLQ